MINNECVFDELDADITADEIIKAINDLKMDKSHGPDCLLNEFFIEYKDFIIPHLCTIFNAVLISGYFPFHGQMPSWYQFSNLVMLMMQQTIVA